MSRFPAAFRLPAFASRSSHSRQGIGSPHGRPTDPHRAGPRRGYRVPHARATTGVGAPYTPRTSGAHPAGSPPRPAPAASQRPVPKPRHTIPPCEAPLHEASTGVHSRSPVRSSPRHRPRDGTSGASASPRASHPAVTGSARRGRGQAIEHGPGTTAQLTSVDLQSGSSLNACDRASHGEQEGSPRSSGSALRQTPRPERAHTLAGAAQSGGLIGATRGRTP